LAVIELDRQRLESVPGAAASSGKIVPIARIVPRQQKAAVPWGRCLSFMAPEDRSRAARHGKWRDRGRDDAGRGTV
jgi:hypothetical protein